MAQFRLSKVLSLADNTFTQRISPANFKQQCTELSKEELLWLFRITVVYLNELREFARFPVKERSAALTRHLPN